ncbi:hypothetical protein D0Z08_20685 [Nocardioides immobilis]|uniref:SGNH hydrolase-type esterase domain-containing protein n=1 Tax=Nocardioides immobilis TaxID=2049295 RepID=A0A417XXR5_9ACTN|nr:GDSL-type esterase/lipase family protein [Nocardioides immobilis]RHW25115.1 hypothetical protein D0Z08_20685 [Nocardioides immobilis]
MLAIVVAGVLAMPGLGPVAAPAAAADEADPVRILLFGDSITQGSTGDWTWRYRLWRDLTDAGISVDFVGPRRDLLTYTPPAFGSLHYKDPAFDIDHAAAWGKRLTGKGFSVSDVTETYQPDVVVGLIGFNDLRYGVTPTALGEKWRAEIALSRDAAPGVDVLLVPLPHIGVVGVRAYNDELAVVAAEMDSPDQRVVLAPRADFGSLDVYDWVHPSASGERKLAAVVEDGLAVLGVSGGARMLELQDPVLAERWAPSPTAGAIGTEITVRWPAVDYASSQRVRVADLTTGVVRTVRGVLGTSYVMTGEPGHAYRFRLYPVKGYLPTGAVSTAARVTIN